MKLFLSTLKQKIISQKFKLILFFCTLMSLLLPGLALADEDTIVQIIGRLGGWLSGPLAGAVAGVAVMFLGYLTLRGRFEAMFFVCVLSGIGIVMGAGYYCHTILLGS